MKHPRAAGLFLLGAVEFGGVATSMAEPKSSAYTTHLDCAQMGADAVVVNEPLLPALDGISPSEAARLVDALSLELSVALRPGTYTIDGRTITVPNANKNGPSLTFKVQAVDGEIHKKSNAKLSKPVTTSFLFIPVRIHGAFLSGDDIKIDVSGPLNPTIKTLPSRRLVDLVQAVVDQGSAALSDRLPSGLVDWGQLRFSGTVALKPGRAIHLDDGHSEVRVKENCVLSVKGTSGGATVKGHLNGTFDIGRKDVWLSGGQGAADVVLYVARKDGVTSYSAQLDHFNVEGSEVAIERGGNTIALRDVVIPDGKVFYSSTGGFALRIENVKGTARNVDVALTDSDPDTEARVTVGSGGRINVKHLFVDERGIGLDLQLENLPLDVNGLDLAFPNKDSGELEQHYVVKTARMDVDGGELSLEVRNTTQGSEKTSGLTSRFHLNLSGTKLFGKAAHVTRAPDGTFSIEGDSKVFADELKLMISKPFNAEACASVASGTSIEVVSNVEHDVSLGPGRLRLEGILSGCIQRMEAGQCASGTSCRAQLGPSNTVATSDQVQVVLKQALTNVESGKVVFRVPITGALVPGATGARFSKGTDAVIEMDVQDKRVQNFSIAFTKEGKALWGAIRVKGARLKDGTMTVGATTSKWFDAISPAAAFGVRASMQRFSGLPRDLPQEFGPLLEKLFSSTFGVNLNAVDFGNMEIDARIKLSGPFVIPGTVGTGITVTGADVAIQRSREHPDVVKLSGVVSSRDLEVEGKSFDFVGPSASVNVESGSYTVPDLGELLQRLIQNAASPPATP